MIDLTLDAILIPDLLGYTPPFGTKVERTAVNKGGLSTQQVNDNIIAGFARQRPVIVSASDTTSVVEYNANINIIPEKTPVTLTMGDGAYVGCTVVIRNAGSVDAGIAGNTARDGNSVLKGGMECTIRWNGSAWEGVCAYAVNDTKVQYPGTDTPESLYPCTKWMELNYGGAFFRASGGLSDSFEKKLTVTGVSNTTLTFSKAHGLSGGQVIYDYEHNESRTVATVPSETTVTVDTAFTSTEITGVMVVQAEGLPNITGMLSIWNHGAAGRGQGIRIATGAFYGTGSHNVGFPNNGNYNDGNVWDTGGFNASISNEIYGASSHVTPINLTTRVWKRIA